MKSLGITCALALWLGVGTGIAAGPSLAGTWKLNLSKSKLTGTTFSIEKAASGLLHFDSQGFAFDFDLTGKEYPAPDGTTVAYRALDANTWEQTTRMNHKVVEVAVSKLTQDTVTMTAKLTKPDGSTVEQTSKAVRVSGGPEFLGKWKSTEVGGAATTMVIALEGANGIAVNYPEYQFSVKGSFDGKDNVATVAGANLKFTVAFEKTGRAGFKMTSKMDGKPFLVDVLTLSPDGKTLTDAGNPTAVNEPTTAVYERQ
ncbi:MAG: hypothetical protein ABSH47_27180 [Bryobacteraceae bacterium]|jgi:hypothetical protein